MVDLHLNMRLRSSLCHHCSICQQISNSDIITGSQFPLAASRVYIRKYHILSGNFTGQQQNRSFDLTEINLLLGFAWNESRKNGCSLSMQYPVYYEIFAGKHLFFTAVIQSSHFIGMISGLYPVLNTWCIFWDEILMMPLCCLCNSICAFNISALTFY